VSNHSMMCCCEGTPQDCADSCDCASSYLVNAISLTYRWQKEVDIGSAWNCNSCPSEASCGHIYEDFAATTQLLTPFTITKQTLGTGSNQVCCYRGTGTIRVYGTLNIGWEYYCGEEECPVTSRDETFIFDRETCVCVHVVCAPNASGCVALPSGPKWAVTVEIGDFIVTCSYDQWQVPFDCDPYCPFDLQQPRAIRSGGASVQFVVPLKCLTSILSGEWSCNGWQNRLVCGDPTSPSQGGDACFDNSGAANGKGAFGMRLESECSPGLDDEDCIDEPVNPGGTSFLDHRLPSTVPQPKCGSWSESLNVCNGLIRTERAQSGCQANAPVVFA
jgi:hypothetical protein